MPEYRLKGHEKFPLREGWIGKGLEGVKEDEKIFRDKKATDRLGVGSNMVKAIRYWLRAFGLTEEHPKKGVSLTEFGKIVAEQDPDLKNLFTLWMMHANLSENKEQATAFYLFFQKNRMEEFTKEEVFLSMKKELVSYLQAEDFSESSLRDDLDVLLNMYGKDKEMDDPEDKNRSPLSRLSLLKKTENGYEKRPPELRKFHENILLYKIVSLLETERSVSIETIAQWAENTFYLSRVDLNLLLDRLEGKGKIELQRTAGLDMIYLAEEKDISRRDVLLEGYLK